MPAMATSPPRLLGWGLLGTARINRMVIPPLRVSPRNRLAAVASRSADRAAAYAREWGIDRAHGRYEALLEDAAVDVVYLPLPNSLHAEWVLLAARAGKHVLCEKPLALSVEEVDRITSSATAAGVVVAEAFMYRHHPQTLKVRELVEQGALGEIRLVRGTFSFPLTRADDVRLRPELGGGCLWDVGCYPVSFARYVLAAEPLEVYGSWRLGPTGIDETFAGQMVFPGGVLVQIDAGFRAPLRAEMEIVGTEGVLRIGRPWRPVRGEPLRLSRRGRTELLACDGEDRYRLEIEDLADAVLEGRSPRISLAESRGNVATLVSLLRSARERVPVSLP